MELEEIFHHIILSMYLFDLIFCNLISLYSCSILILRIFYFLIWNLCRNYLEELFRLYHDIDERINCCRFRRNYFRFLSLFRYSLNCF